MKRIVALIMILISISMAMVAPAMADERVTIEPTASGFHRSWFVRLLKQIRVTIYKWGTNEESEEKNI